MLAVVLLLCGQPAALPSPVFLPSPQFDTMPVPKFAAPPAVVRTGYPVHNGPHWTYPGEIRAHLTSSAKHRGKWPAEWIRGLSTLEAVCLHDADHTGTVQWQYVPGGKKAATAAPRTLYIIPKP